MKIDLKKQKIYDMILLEIYILMKRWQNHLKKLALNRYQRQNGVSMQIIKLSVGDRILMKKKHPCSADIFQVMRVGSDVRVKCEGCGRDMTFQRESLEKMIKRVIATEDKG